jgi:DNA-binding NarL/FixJ family response regulator
MTVPSIDQTANIGEVFQAGVVSVIDDRSLEYATVPLRVLVVDDHPAILRHVSSWVRSTIVAEVVATSSDPAGVPAIWSEVRPDVTLCDVHMPEVDGLELCRRLCRQDPAAVVLLFSARDDSALRQQADDAGARGLISKTATPQELAAALLAAAGR